MSVASGRARAGILVCVNFYILLTVVGLTMT